MKYRISNFNVPRNQLSRKLQASGRKIKEYYIHDQNGHVVAGDFRSYKDARTYLTTTLTRRS